MSLSSSRRLGLLAQSDIRRMTRERAERVLAEARRRLERLGAPA